MAVQFVTCATGQSTSAPTTTVNIAVPQVPNALMLIKAGNTAIGAGTRCPVSVTVSGFWAGFWCCQDCYNLVGGGTQVGLSNAIYYLCNPPTGAVVVTVTWQGAGVGLISEMVIAEIWSGVDLPNPLYGCAKACGNEGTSPTITFPSQIGWVATDSTIQRDQGWMTQCVGQILTCRVSDDRGSDRDGRMAGSYEPGAASVTMCYTDVNTWNMMAVNILPYVETIGRKADYFFDTWDPEQRIVDAMDRELQPWEIEPDHWMRITGLIIPTGHIYASFDEDPEMAYIESVSWSEEGESQTISVETNRGDLPDIVLRRAAQGSVGG